MEITMPKTILILFLFTLFSDPLQAYEDKFTCYDKWPDASPPYHFTPNECGPDSSLAEIIPNKFGSVNLGEICNAHDRCWLELKDENAYGRCEARFTRDLIKACAKAEKCFKTSFGKKCIPNPMEMAACEGMIVTAYSGAATTSVFFLRLKNVRKEQKEFEECVKKYGYHKRPPKKKK